ncbi:hypothetical protein JCM3775_007194 [Rhodotorula graminis]
MTGTHSRSASPEPDELDDYSEDEEHTAPDQLVSRAKALHDQVRVAWRRILEPDFLDPVSEYHELDMQILAINQELENAVTDQVKRPLVEKRDRLRRERQETRRSKLSQEAVALYVEAGHLLETLQNLEWSADATYLEDAYGVETDGYNVLEHHSNQVKQTRRTAVAARQQKDTARRLAAARRRAQQAGTTPSRRRHTFQQHSSRLSQAHVPSSSPEHDEAHALGRRRASRDGDFRRAWLYFQREY